MNTDDIPESVDSPCQLVCYIDKGSNMCLGCGRTPEEIANWPLRSKTDRDRILSELPARMPPLDIKLAERRKLRRITKRGKRSANS